MRQSFTFVAGAYHPLFNLGKSDSPTTTPNRAIRAPTLPRMATGVDAKLLKATKFPPEFNQKVDMRKVNLQVMKKWITGRISEILGNEDDVVIELCSNLIEDNRFPDIKSIQIQITGFLDKDTPTFCKELWNLCLSAQASPQGVPKELLEAKKRELLQEKIEAEKAAEKAAEEARQRREALAGRDRGGRGEGRFDSWRGGGGRGRGGGFGDRDFARRGGAGRGRDRSRSPPGRGGGDSYRAPPRDTYVPRGRQGGPGGRRADTRRRSPTRSASAGSGSSRSSSRSGSAVSVRRSVSRSPSPSRRRRAAEPRYRGARKRSRSAGRSFRSRRRSSSGESSSRSPSPKRRRRSRSRGKSGERHRGRSRSVSSSSSDRRSASRSPKPARRSGRASTSRSPSHDDSRRSRRGGKRARSSTRSSSPAGARDNRRRRPHSRRRSRSRSRGRRRSPDRSRRRSRGGSRHGRHGSSGKRRLSPSVSPPRQPRDTSADASRAKDRRPQLPASEAPAAASSLPTKTTTIAKQEANLQREKELKERIIKMRRSSKSGPSNAQG
ncbi:hypothetical protein RB597_004607 [Gaeumannomyces tritici]